MNLKKGNCTYQDSIHIKTLSPPFIPNVFTPNHDQTNETFDILGLKQPVSLIVSDRWGIEVYKNGAYTSGWDGGNLPDGTYFYSLLGTKEACLDQKKGWVQLLR